MQRWRIHSCAEEVVRVPGVVAHRGIVGSNISSPGCDWNWTGEEYLLRSVRSFVDKGGCAQERSCIRPDMADVCARVRAGFVESQSCDVSVCIYTEPYSDFNCMGIIRVDCRRCRSRLPDGVARAGCWHSEVDTSDVSGGDRDSSVTRIEHNS